MDRDRILIRLIGTALLCLAFFSGCATPFHRESLGWQYDPANFPRIARSFGCTAWLIISDKISPLRSYYSGGNQRLVIGIKEDPQMPYYAGLAVLLHEVGHCLQHQEGYYTISFYPFHSKPTELNADMRSVDMLCRLGLPGQQIHRDLLVWARDHLGYNGDPGHGTIAERIAQANLAPSCY